MSDNEEPAEGEPSAVTDATAAVEVAHAVDEAASLSGGQETSPSAADEPAEEAGAATTSGDEPPAPRKAAPPQVGYSTRPESFLEHRSPVSGSTWCAASQPL